MKDILVEFGQELRGKKRGRPKKIKGPAPDVGTEVTSRASGGHDTVPLDEKKILDQVTSFLSNTEELRALVRALDELTKQRAETLQKIHGLLTSAI